MGPGTAPRRHSTGGGRDSPSPKLLSIAFSMDVMYTLHD